MQACLTSKWLEAEIKLLEEELEGTKADEADYISQASKYGGMASRKGKVASDGSFLGLGVMGLVGAIATKIVGDQKSEAAKQAKEWGATSREYAKSAEDAHAKIGDLELKLKDAKEKLKGLDTL